MCVFVCAICSLFETVKKCAVVPSKIEGYVQDLMGIIKGKSMNYDDNILRSISIDLAIEWMWCNAAVLSQFAQPYMLTNKFSLQSKFEQQAYFDRLLQQLHDVDISTIEKALSMDLCWTVMNGIEQLQQEDSSDKILDGMIYLSQFKPFCEKIAQSNCIIDWLIIKLRSRNTLHFRLDLIIYHLFKFNLVNKKYYSDLGLTLTTLLECDRKMRNIQLISNFKHYLPIFECVTNSLKVIFGIPIEFEFVDCGDADGDGDNYSKLKMKKYQCVVCKELVMFPHKLKHCKHVCCYLCLATKLQIKKNKNRKQEAKNDSDNNDDDEYGIRQCCVQTCNSATFNYNDCEKFNYSIANKINSLNIRVNGLFSDGLEFIGTMQQFWEKVKQDSANINNNIISNDEFEYFVNLMIKETTVKQVSQLKQLKTDALAKKAEGNGYFKQHKFDLAIECYKDALNTCPNQYKQDRVVYLSNIALCYIRMTDYFNAYCVCLKALSYDPSNVKITNSLIKCYENLSFQQLFSNNNNNGDGTVLNDQEPKINPYIDSPNLNLKLKRINTTSHVFKKVKFDCYRTFIQKYAMYKCLFQIGMNPNDKSMAQPTPNQMEKLETAMKEFAEKDSTQLVVQQSVRQNLKEIDFINVYFFQFYKKYEIFIQDYQKDKKRIYQTVFDILANHCQQLDNCKQNGDVNNNNTNKKQKQSKNKNKKHKNKNKNKNKNKHKMVRLNRFGDSEENMKDGRFISVSKDVLPVVQNTFKIEKSLLGIVSNVQKQQCLIHGFYTTCYDKNRNYKSGEFNQDAYVVLPMDLVRIISDYIFLETKYNFNKICDYKITNIVDKGINSKIKSFWSRQDEYGKCIRFRDDGDNDTGSDDSNNNDDNDDDDNESIYHNNWKDIEFDMSDYGGYSADEEFVKHL